jgi:hypothetical protein
MSRFVRHRTAPNWLLSRKTIRPRRGIAWMDFLMEGDYQSFGEMLPGGTDQPVSG